MGIKEMLTAEQMAVLGVARRKMLNAGYSRTSRERAHQPLPKAAAKAKADKAAAAKKGHKKGPFKNKRSKKQGGEKRQAPAPKPLKPKATKATSDAPANQYQHIKTKATKTSRGSRGEGNTVSGQRKRGAAGKTVKTRAPKDLSSTTIDERVVFLSASTNTL